MPDRKRQNPANQNENIRKAAKRVFELFTQKQLKQQRDQATEIFRRASTQPIRLDQFDNKRSYEEMIDNLERKEDTRRLSSVDVTLPSKRRMIRA